MHYYLKHPVHGTKVAISEQELVADEKLGWSRYDPHKPTPPAVNELEGKRRRRTNEV